jgi:hypothetical protein
MKNEPDSNAQRSQPTNSSTIYGLSNAVVRLFHTADRIALADIEMDGRRRYLGGRANEFRQWIALNAYKATGEPSQSAV